MKFLLIFILINVVIGEGYTKVTKEEDLCCAETVRADGGRDNDLCLSNCMKDKPDSVGFTTSEGCECCGKMVSFANRGNASYCSQWDERVFRVTPKSDECSSGVKIKGVCCDHATATVVNGVVTYNCYDDDNTNDGHSSGGTTEPEGGPCEEKTSDCVDRRTARRWNKPTKGKRNRLGKCVYPPGDRTEDCEFPKKVCFRGECKTRMSPETEGPKTRGPETEGPKTRGPDTRGPNTRGPKTRGPDTEGPNTRGPDTRGPGRRGPGRRGPGKRGPGDNGPGPRTRTPGGPGTKGPGTNASETEGPGTEGPGTEGPGTRGPNTEGPRTRGPDTRGPSTEGPGTRGPSTEGPKTRGPKTRGPDTRGPSTGGPGHPDVHWCAHVPHQNFGGVKCTGRWRYRPNSPTCVYCRNNGDECCMLANAETN